MYNDLQESKQEQGTAFRQTVEDFSILSNTCIFLKSKRQSDAEPILQVLLDRRTDLG